MRHGPLERTIESALEPSPHPDRADTIKQTIKWVVYSLLLVNWGYYIFDDWRVAQHTLQAGDSFVKHLNAYATSLDELAWFVMLFLFEAETYSLSDEQLNRFVQRLFIGLRIACYLFLANTVYAYIFDYFELISSPLVNGVSATCDLVDQSFSFVRNLAYTTIDANNCNALSSASTFYQIGGDNVITDAAGIAELKILYAVDIEDAIVWLSVVLLIELVLQLQEKGISKGPMITGSNFLTIALYAILVGNALYWFWKGHYVYGWDELLWIGGFAAIEMNLSEWRKELSHEAVAA